MFRSSLILTVIFIILAGFIIYQNNLSKQDGLLDIDVDSVDLISISYGGVSKEIILKKTGSEWFLLDKKIKNIEKVYSIIRDLDGLTFNNLGLIKSNDDLIKYGLDIPVLKIMLRDKKGKECSLYLGDKSPVKDLRYGLVKNSNSIVTLEDIYDILVFKEKDFFKE